MGPTECDYWGGSEVKAARGLLRAERSSWSPRVVLTVLIKI